MASILSESSRNSYGSSINGTLDVEEGNISILTAECICKLFICCKHSLVIVVFQPTFVKDTQNFTTSRRLKKRRTSQESYLQVKGKTEPIKGL